jgi:hypothetical protein
MPWGAGSWERGGGWGRQASVNPKAETVEELLGRRKNLHMGMSRLARDDLALTLTATLDSFLVLPPPHLPFFPPSPSYCVASRIPESPPPLFLPPGIVKHDHHYHKLKYTCVYNHG